MATQILPDSASLAAAPLIRLARTRLGWFAQLLGLGIIHYLALRLPSFPHAQIAFGDGVAVAGLLVLGLRAFPVVFISGLCFYLQSLPANLAIYYAAAATLTAVTAVAGLKWSGWKDFGFERVGDVVRYVGIAAVVSPLVYIVTAPLAQWMVADEFQLAGMYSLMFYIRSLLGILLVAPVLLTWLGSRPTYPASAGWFELGALAASICSVALLSGRLMSIAYLPLFLLLCWAGTRAGARGTTLASLGICAITGYLTRNFGEGTPEMDRMMFIACLNLWQGVVVLLLSASVTERQRIQEQEQEIHEAYRTLVAAAPFGVIGINRIGEVTLWSTAAEQIYGWTADEVVGRPLPTIPASRQDEFNQMLANPGVMAGHETIRRRKDGTELEISLTTWPLHDLHGRLIGEMGVHHDITDQKRAAEALSRSEEQLRQAMKMEAIGRLAGGVAHDFNNLLTSVLGHAGLALDSVDSRSPIRDDLMEIQAAGGRAAQLTQQLLAFSRKQMLEPRLVDLNTVVTGIARMLRRTIGEDIELATRLASDLGTVRADPVQMEQVLLNLAVNARDAMPAGGRLTIETTNVIMADGSLVRVRVQDTGMGMSEEVRAHLFEPFYTTKDVGKGTGLGLATAYGIVQQSGGNISVVSEVGEGSTFIVDLPMVRGEPAPVEPVPDFVPRGGSETILLVEDEESVRSLTRRVLELQGYRVMSAASGESALELSRSYGERIHLLLSDVVMPGISGPKLAEVLLAERTGMRLIYMSGYAATMLERGIELGSDTAFLQKPFTTEQLMRRVREVLDAETATI